MWDMLQTTQNDNHRPTPALRALDGFILILCLYEDFNFFMIDECQYVKYYKVVIIRRNLEHLYLIDNV